MDKAQPLSSFVKYHREQLGLSQEDLASKSGVGLRFIREMEQGKQTLRMDKINKVLALFGHEMRAERNTIDAYDIWRNYFNKAIVITLKNQKQIPGFIISEIKDDEQKIIAWKVVPNKNAMQWQKTKSKELELTISHNEIAEIDLQDNEKNR